MTEAIKIVIEGNDEQGGHVPVQDALNQVLDSLALVTDAIDEDVRKDLDWRFVNVSMNSPLVVSIEPFSRSKNGPNIIPFVRESIERSDRIFREIFKKNSLQFEIRNTEKEILKKIFKRGINKKLRTHYYWLGHENPIIFNASLARIFLEKMNKINIEDSIVFQGIELGSIEGKIVDAITHYGKPAVRILHQISQQEIMCLIPQKLENKIGENHSWNEIWEKRRYIVTGKIKRKSNGDIAQLYVDEIHAVEVNEVDLDKIADPDFTGGKSTVEYLDELWGE